MQIYRTLRLLDTGSLQLGYHELFQQSLRVVYSNGYIGAEVVLGLGDAGSAVGSSNSAWEERGSFTETSVKQKVVLLSGH